MKNETEAQRMARLDREAMLHRPYGRGDAARTYRKDLDDKAEAEKQKRQEKEQGEQHGKA